jgi:hypothetical protein
VSEFERPLYQELQQSHWQLGPLHDYFSNLRARPSHPLNVVVRSCLFGALLQTYQGRFAKELIRLVDVDQHLTAVASQPRYLNLAIDYR